MGMLQSGSLVLFIQQILVEKLLCQALRSRERFPAFEKSNSFEKNHWPHVFDLLTESVRDTSQTGLDRRGHVEASVRQHRAFSHGGNLEVFKTSY